MDMPGFESLPLRKRLEIASHGEMPVYDGMTVAGLTKLGFSMDELYRFVAPRRTLARRIAKGEALTIPENDSALRLVRIVGLANRIFGNEEKARQWLRKPNRSLSGIAPIDLLESEAGAHMIEEALYRIDYGIYA